MRFSPLLAVTALFTCLSSAQAAPTPTQAATCVAALKSRAEPLAERVRKGDAAAEAQLLPVVTDSFAFIGTSYKQGVESAEAKELLKAAEAKQATMPPAELAKVQDACQVEGKQLLAQASGFERMFVSHAARTRIEKLKKRPDGNERN
jgi:hypothetical protein